MGASDPRSTSDAPTTRARALGVIAATCTAIAGLVACNQLLGTDKFSEGDDLGPDGGSQDGPTTDANQDFDSGQIRDAGIDVYIQLPPGSQPATWAQWPMPDRLLDAGPTTSYTVQGTSVLDNVTQLVWQKSGSTVAANPATFADAKKACDALADGGANKWRVPTRIELASLLDHIDDAGVPKANTGSATIDPVFGGAGGAYWTSSPVLPAGTPLKFWFVNFQTGGLERNTTGPYLRCVKEGP